MPSAAARTARLLMLVAAAAASAQAQDRARTPAAADFTQTVAPLLERYCVRCHGPDKQKGDVRLDTLDPAMPALADAETWHTALDMLTGGEMPPDDERQPSAAERAAIVDWLSAALRAAADRHADERRPVLRRLTREQYTHSLQDVLGVPIDFGRRLPPDAKAKSGFHNDGEALQSSPLHLELYETIARQAVAQAIVIGDRPPVTRYRVTFGAGIGVGKVAGTTGGYQSVPLPTDDFALELLDDRGEPLHGGTDEQRRERERIQRRISVGLRGSSQDRFRVVDEGMILLSALPHREVAPGAWQGPSPNLKLELQRCWPEQGDFVMRVVASRGYLPPLRKQLLVGFDDDGSTPTALAAVGADDTLETAPGAIVLPAVAADQKKNLRPDRDALLPVAVPDESDARLGFHVPADAFYQVDLVHRPAAADAMPSVRLRAAGHHLDQRLRPTDAWRTAARVVTPLGVLGMHRGGRQLQVGGPFFVGFTHVVLTPLGAEHPLVRRLTERDQTQAAAVQELVPVIRALCGTRTDDGMDYATFGEPREVRAPLGRPETYEFVGRLEDLPIPEPESGDTEELSGFLLLGLWNDHLVKSARETGPPLLIRSIEFEAPYLPVWPPPSHTAILFDAPERGDEDAYTRLVLRRFVARAFRRPARDADVERYLSFWRELRPAFASYEASLREVLVAILCSPQFLFLCEAAPADDATGPASGGGEPAGEALPEWALANRLAYFLWDSPPDDTLRELAAQGRLRRELLTQVDRMLDDDRVWRFVRAFTRDWLRLDRHADIAIDVDRFPDYTRFVERDMQLETVAFVHRVIAADLPLATFVAADFAMLNQNLAEFYGVPGVLGPAFRPVPVGAPERRGGLLSHGAFLAGHSDGSEPHPIKRAVWLKARLLGDPPPPPPPNVPALPKSGPGVEQLTLKQRLAAHRDQPSCRDCHAGIDPYGFVFERLSAVGRLENERHGHPVDATATLPDGTEVDGLDGLQRYLTGARQDAFARAFVGHLFRYALGRELCFGDDAELAAILRQVQVAGYRTRAVFRAIVAAASFQSP